MGARAQAAVSTWEGGAAAGSLPCSGNLPGEPTCELCQGLSGSSECDPLGQLVRSGLRASRVLFVQKLGRSL